MNIKGSDDEKDDDADEYNSAVDFATLLRKFLNPANYPIWTFSLPGNWYWSNKYRRIQGLTQFNFFWGGGMKWVMIIYWIVNNFFLENIYNDIFLRKGVYGFDDDDDDDGPGAFDFVTILRNWLGKIAWNGLFAAISLNFFLLSRTFLKACYCLKVIMNNKK